MSDKIDEIIYVSPMPGQAIRKVNNWHSGYNEYTRELVEMDIEQGHIITSEVRKHLIDKPGYLEEVKKYPQFPSYLNAAWYPGTHKPVLDIDFGAELMSGEVGHTYLRLEKELSTENHFDFLMALDKAGIIKPVIERNIKLPSWQPSSKLPLLILNCKATLLPSSTEGHFHLFLDKEMSWKSYKKLLEILAQVTIIEEGYMRASVAREYSAVRLPWVKKGNPLTEELMQELGEEVPKGEAPF